MNNFGRSYPHGGIFDPATAIWEPLPDGRPGAAEPTCPAHDAAGPEIVVSGHAALDVVARTWEPVSCNRVQAEFDYSSAWIDDRLVTWGGYEVTGDRSGGSTVDVELLNTGSWWRPSSS